MVESEDKEGDGNEMRGRYTIYKRIDERRS